ncbi:MAG: tetratricopeptide repeat protein [Myxococcales bacterium]|nr:tetratricopeptide repeat protein [Myxococcales bacterium]
MFAEEMTSRLARLAFALALAATLGACTAPAWLRPPDEGPGKKARVDYTVNKQAWKHLDRAQKALAEKDYKAAKEELDEMQERKKRFNEYELALMWQTYAHMYADQEDMPAAAAALQNALAGETLPEGALIDAMYNLGQLQLATEQYDKAAATFTRWLELAGDKATPEARYVIGVAFAQAKQYEKATEQVRAALAAVDTPPENWLQLLMSVRFELGDLATVEDVLKQLLQRYPRKAYWQQLAGVYAEKRQDEKALAVMELMHTQGILESRDELLRLAQMYLFMGVPQKATAVLTGGLDGGPLERDEKTLELLASSYLYARESEDAKGILAEAAKKSDSGEIYLQLARQQLRDGQFEAAAASARRGINKGGVDNPGQAWLLLGSIHFNAEEWSAALDAFRRAEGFDDTRATAAQWRAAAEGQIEMARAEAQAAAGR